MEIIDRINEKAKWYQEKLRLFNNATDRASGQYDEIRERFEKQFRRDLYVMLTEGREAPTYDEYIASLSIAE